MRKLGVGLVLLLGLLCSPALGQNATLLPPAQLQFNDMNGVPLAGGTVKFCVPNTGCNTLKSTWKDSGQLTLNPNPIPLDSAGRATIYGSGAYEMQVYDVNGAQIYTGQTSAFAGALLSNSSPLSVLGNLATTSGPPTSVPIQLPLAFINGKLGISPGLVTDTSNQTVGPAYVGTTRLAKGTNPLTYTVVNSVNLGPGFTFTVVANVQTTVTFDVADTVLLNSNTITLLPGMAAQATTDGAGTWYLQTTRMAAQPTRIAGEVLKMRGTTCPPGSLLEDGSAVSRTTYALLFAQQGVAFGAGDGSTTFNLANSGGQFDRGWVNGQTVDSGRVFGSIQLDAFQTHGHNYSYGTVGYGNAAAGSNQTLNSFAIATGGTTGPTSGRSSNETRPTNITVLSCVVTGLVP